MKETIAYSENQLIIAVRAGDAQAFDQLFRRYGNRLYFFSLGYLKSKTEAEEVVQEVFLKIWNNRKSLNPDLSFKAYIFKIAFRHIQELFQKISREQAYRHEILDSSVDFNNELDDRMNYQSLLNLVDRVIDELPPRQREILVRRRKLGFSVKEIAEELGIAPKTVENHLTEALRTIKTRLSQESPGGLLFFYLFVK